MNKRSERSSPSGFLRELGNAILRVLGFGVVYGAHWLDEQFIEWLSPEGPRFGAQLTEAIADVVFVLISIQLLIDLLVIFIPWLKHIKRLLPKPQKRNSGTLPVVEAKRGERQIRRP